MKSRKSKKYKKTKLNLFQEVDFKPKSAEMAALVLVCAVVFGISFSGSGKLLYDYGQKKGRSALSSNLEMQIVKSAIAAENQNKENTAGAEENVPSGESRDSKVMVEVTNSELLAQADRKAKASRIARQRAAERALINNAPILAGPTAKLPDGKRTCPLKHPRPSSRGGKPHVDEDCCADYDEYPNPRCDYSPAQMAALKKH
ncbi:hypothetical protein D4Q76_02265 [archaeon]|nr:MAG: hypothetical protein D4Q76_02265 [archaeon]